MLTAISAVPALGPAWPLALATANGRPIARLSDALRHTAQVSVLATRLASRGSGLPTRNSGSRAVSGGDPASLSAKPLTHPCAVAVTKYHAAPGVGPAGRIELSLLASKARMPAPRPPYPGVSTQRAAVGRERRRPGATSTAATAMIAAANPRYRHPVRGLRSSTRIV